MIIPRLTILELELKANKSDNIPKEILTDFEKIMIKLEKLIQTDKSNAFS
jgi:hypothetical protein